MRCLILVALLFSCFTTQAFAQQPAQPPRPRSEMVKWFRILTDVLTTGEWVVSNKYSTAGGFKVSIQAFNQKEFGERMGVNLFYSKDQHNGELYEALIIGDVVRMERATKGPHDGDDLGAFFNPQKLGRTTDPKNPENLPALDSAKVAQLLAYGTSQRIDLGPDQSTVVRGNARAHVLRMSMFLVGRFECVTIDVVAAPTHQNYNEYLKAMPRKIFGFTYSPEPLDRDHSIGAYLTPKL